MSSHVDSGKSLKVSKYTDSHKHILDINKILEKRNGELFETAGGVQFKRTDNN